MYKGIIALITMLFLLTACNTSDPITSSELDNFVISQASQEVTQDDFVFRLVSEKEEYKEGEEVKLYAEIEYIGEKDEITILHSSSAVLFPIEEKVRGYEIVAGVDDIGLSTTLKQGVPFREDYIKGGGYSPSQDPKDYIDFIQDFIDRDDFPAGYYVVNGYTDFFVEDNGERYNIEAQIDFKVTE